MKKITFWLLGHTVQFAMWVLVRIDYYFGKTVSSLDSDLALSDPHANNAVIRKHGPILRSYMYDGWVVTGYKEASELLRDSRISNDFSNNQFITGMVRLAAGKRRLLSIDDLTMLSVDAPDHTRLRKLVAKGFMHKYVQSLAPTIERLVDELLDNVPADGEQFDIMELLARPLPAIVIAEMMGVPLSERHLFENWSEALLGATDIGNPELIRKSGDANMQMRAYLAELTETKRRAPGQDLISQLIAAEEDGDKLTLDELYSNCILLLVAGHETTTRLIGNCLHLLFQHPEQMALARSSEKNIVNALEETLRFEPPVLFTVRTVGESMTYRDCNLKRGQMILLSIAAANRDPEVNVDPDHFNIERENITHLSFGYGIHLCLGMSLARLEAKIVFNKLFERYANLQLEDKSPDWGSNPMFRGLETLTISGSEAETVRFARAH